MCVCVCAFAVRPNIECCWSWHAQTQVLVKLFHISLSSHTDSCCCGGVLVSVSTQRFWSYFQRMIQNSMNMNRILDIRRLPWFLNGQVDQFRRCFLSVAKTHWHSIMKNGIWLDVQHDDVRRWVFCVSVLCFLFVFAFSILPYSKWLSKYELCDSVPLDVRAIFLRKLCCYACNACHVFAEPVLCK